MEENQTQELNQQNDELDQENSETVEETTENTNQQTTTPVFKPNVNQEDDGQRWFMKKQTVKDKIRELNCQIGDNFFPRLNEFIEDTLVKAVYRTKCNKRKTVRAMDI